MKFMFEPISSGVVETLCSKFQEQGIRYGFGGVAALGQGALPAEKIIVEHYRVGSSIVILSRSFCHPDKCEDLQATKEYFDSEVQKIRDFEKIVATMSKEEMLQNKENVDEIIKQICHK